MNAPAPMIRLTTQRQIILEELAKVKTHPTASELYDMVRKRLPRIGLGTVYRNLALFREEGKAMSVATVAGQERFDGRTHPHAHFICEKCGRVDDVDAVLPETLVTGEMPGEVRSWALTFYGICRCCAADDNKNNKEKN